VRTRPRPRVGRQCEGKRGIRFGIARGFLEFPHPNLQLRDHLGLHGDFEQPATSTGFSRKNFAVGIIASKDLSLMRRTPSLEAQHVSTLQGRQHAVVDNISVHVSCSKRNKKVINARPPENIPSRSSLECLGNLSVGHRPANRGGHELQRELVHLLAVH
jgi:hypothetical protein